MISTAIFLFSCAQSNEKIETHQENITIQKLHKINDRFPYTDEDVRQFYTYDTETGLYEVNVSNSQWTSFKLNEVAIPLKENDFDLQQTVDTKYTVLETLEFSSPLSCKVIMYNTIGDNDTEVLNIQLNSYLNGNLRDQLLLDSRFTFETEYFRTFEIQEDQKIRIHKFSVNNLEFNDVGDIVGEKEVSDTLKVTVDYKLMNDGIFKKL